MRKTWAILLCVAVIVATLCGCADSGEQLSALQNEVDELRNEVSFLQEQNTKLAEKNDGLVLQLERISVDTTPPIIIMLETELEINTGEEIDFTLYARAFDDKDGDVTSSITIDENGINCNEAGTYVVYYNVADTSGNHATASLDILVADTKEVGGFGVAVSDSALTRPDANLRNVKWGDSIKMVKQSESAKLEREDEKYLIYSTTVSGYDVLFMYNFSNDYGLHQAICNPYEKYTNNYLYIVRYDAIKSDLIAKYGEPSKDEIIKTSGMADYSIESDALWLGYTLYATQWDTDSELITLGMSQEDKGIMTVVNFQSKDYETQDGSSGW